ncbi:MAG: clan AA aspartic protease [Acidobacteria bacterium]|nr:clan AA aspartic protease [Acidobacteriota bacterium]
MGEVVVKTKLTNWGDAEMSRRRKLPRNKIRSLEVSGIADCGAVTLTMPATLSRRLGLVRTGTEIVAYADGSREEVPVVEGVIVEIQGRRSISRALVLGEEVLIGQTVLEEMDYLVDCRNQRLIPAHAEGQVAMVRRRKRQ